MSPNDKIKSKKSEETSDSTSDSAENSKSDPTQDLIADDVDSVSRGKKTRPAKRKKSGSSQATSRADGLPKDRNKRVREQAELKMRQAKESAKDRATRIGATGLDTGEMLEDALARGVSATLKWAKRNRRYLELGVLAVILAVGGYAGWDWYSTKKREEASTALMRATVNAEGVVQDKSEQERLESADKETKLQIEREKLMDPRPRFESYKALQQEALRTYRVAVDEHGSSGPATLARLGEAGVLLDRKDYDGAIKQLELVLKSDLGNADESVKMTCKERLAMAHEGKGDMKAAAEAYAQLAASSLKWYKDLGLYHQARLAMASGDKDAAKQKFTTLKDRLKGKDAIEPTGGNRYLLAQLDAMQRELDPNAEPLIAPRPATNQLTPEQIQKLQQQLEQLRKEGTGEIPKPSEPTPVGSGGTDEPPPSEQPNAPNPPQPTKQDPSPTQPNPETKPKQAASEPPQPKDPAPPTPPTPPATQPPSQSSEGE